MESLRGAVLVDHRSRDELGENQPPIGRPAEGINDVTERRVAAREFFALQQAAPFSSVFLQPDVVALQIILLGVKLVANGIDDAAIGREGECGNIFIDVKQGFARSGLCARAAGSEQQPTTAQTSEHRFRSQR